MVRGAPQFLIRFYQATLAHFLGGRCRFYPSCSHYAIAAYDELSFSTATFLVLKRFLSCHPFSRKPFYDPLPRLREEKSI